MMRIVFVFGMCLALSFALFLALPVDLAAQGAGHYKYKVIETRISREEFLEAYLHRLEYNQVRDTTLDWHTKKAVEVAVFRTLSDDEKEAYVWTDYIIDNIGYYSTGEYVADMWYGNWAGAVFLDKEFQIDTTVINGSDRAAYSNKGIYAGCRGFDCDNIAWFYFYGHRSGELAKMELIAEYVNNTWCLPWGEKFPEFDGLDYHQAIVWYKDVLYCFGVQKYDDQTKEWCSRPIFMKLKLERE